MHDEMALDQTPATEAAEPFMVGWHEDEAEMTREQWGVRRCPKGTVGGEAATGEVVEYPTKGNAERRGNMRSRSRTAVDESRKEMADRVETH